MVIAKGDSACDPPVFSLFGPFLEHKIVIAKGESACEALFFSFWTIRLISLPYLLLLRLSSLPLVLPSLPPIASLRPVSFSCSSFLLSPSSSPSLPSSPSPLRPLFVSLPASLTLHPSSSSFLPPFPVSSSPPPSSCFTPRSSVFPSFDHSTNNRAARSCS